MKNINKGHQCFDGRPIINIPKKVGGGRRPRNQSLPQISLVFWLVKLHNIVHCSERFHPLLITYDVLNLVRIKNWGTSSNLENIFRQSLDGVLRRILYGFFFRFFFSNEREEFWLVIPYFGAGDGRFIIIPAISSLGAPMHRSRCQVQFPVPSRPGNL